MRNLTERWWRITGVVIAMFGFGMVGVSSVSAEEICRPNGALGLVDGNGDGLVDRGELQGFVDSVGDAPGIDDLRSVVNNWPANLTGIRYTGCTADGGGSGDGGTGNNGGGTGEGGGTGNNGGGTGDGSGTGSGDGSGSGSGDGSGTENPTTVVIIDGTPVVVDAVTGLPATGQGDASAPGSISGGSIALFGLSALGLAAAGTLIGWRRRTS